ncbi:MAG: cupin domain-containing protein [Thermomicrobiales bacterium]
MNFLVSAEHMPIFPVGPKGSFAHVFNGAQHGLPSVSLMMSELQPGEGPSLHRHEYDEVFVVEEGTGTFLIGETSVEATQGNVVLIPAGMPHAFTNAGEAILRLTAVHVASRGAIEWMEPSSSEDPGDGNSR